ncbi:methyl-accepting chemotaxis protein [Devosia sp.]|uniref:methyl-accepting chemotaxis protein n=1 Tax=Devosia sp. TaxID=1871048 RepID=UPI003A8D6996
MQTLQLGLRAKLLVMASVTLVTVAAVATVYFLLDARIGAASRDAEQAAERVAELAEAQTLALELLSHTEAFLIEPTEESAATVTEEAAELQSLLPGLANAPEVQSALSSMPAAAEQVVSELTQLGLNENEGLQGSLRASVRGVEGQLNGLIEGGLNLDGLMVKMLMLRRHEKDFMLREDPKYVDRFADAITEFTAALPLSPLPVLTQRQLAEAIDVYRAEFGAYAVGLLALSDTIHAFEDDVNEASAIASERLAGAEARRAAAQADLASLRASMTTTLTVTFVVAAILALVLAFFISRAISRPIVGMTAAMQRLADGELDVDVPGRTQRDEIGAMAGAVEVFKQNAIRVSELGVEEAARAGETRARNEAGVALIASLSDVVEHAIAGDFSRRVQGNPKYEDLQSVATGVNDLLETVDGGISETGRVLAALARMDLTERMEGTYHGAFAKLQTDTNAVGTNLIDIVGQLRDTSGSVKAATGEILTGANDLAERTTKQAAAIEETSAAMEQLANTVSENAKRADSASEKAQSVSQTASETGDVMERSTDAMQRITESSAKISNIIGLIDDIAFQTNLLALNASVEAARAGDAGKGFAVVAIEVRRLAQSAAQASSDVKALIEQSSGEVAGGTRLVAEASQKLGTMLEGVRESASLVEGIASASRQQSTGIAEVTSAIRQMDEMTQHNAALVEETNAAIEQTEAQATELDRIVSVFVVDAAGQRAAPEAAPAPKGIKRLQAKVKSVASTYLGGGAKTAVNQDWSEF